MGVAAALAVYEGALGLGNDVMTSVRPRTLIAQLLQLLLSSCLQDSDCCSISAAGISRLHVCQLVTTVTASMT